MNEKVETRTTVGESPFSNGIVERHLYFCLRLSLKLCKMSCEPDVALAWALSAKNGLQNSGDFNSNQLVFGHNVNTPSVLTDQLPALQATTS